MSTENKKNRPDLIAYAVTEGNDKSYFTRIGAAWYNSKGGAKVILDAFPVEGEMLLLPPKEDDSRDG